MFHNYLNTLDMMAARLATWFLGILFSAGLAPLAPAPAWAAEADTHAAWSTPLLLLLAVGLGFLLAISLLQNRFLHRRLQRQAEAPSSGRAAPSAGRDADDLLHDAVFHNVGAGILIVEDNGLISRANEEFALLTGYLREEVEGKMLWTELVPPWRLDQMLEYAKQRRLDPMAAPRTHETQLVGRHGQSVHAQIIISPILDTESTVVSIFDVTAWKQTEEELRRQALNDPLTGLPNRILFIDRLAHTIKLAKRDPDYQYAVLYLDLDRFKLINDSLGHAVGDKLLVAFKDRLSEVFREVDTVARTGGDEFAVLLEGVNSHEGSLRAAERLKEILAQPFQIEGREIFSSMSMGLVLSDVRYENPEQILRDADTAMYQSKERGRGNYQVFHVQMHEQAMNLMRVESDLRRALREQEFYLVYQPIVHAASANLAGFEALIRWSHPERGVVPPMEFIPVAEECGLIQPLGDWVLEEACRNAHLVLDKEEADESLFISVNLSVHQLTKPNLAERIEDLLERYQIKSHNLKLEITETVLMKNAFSVIPTLERLRMLGVRLAIDDFGTGYSSLSYLHYLPVDTLKVDKAFIRELDDHTDRPRIIQTIMRLAQSMNKIVVAEGVETMEQYQVLRSMDCHYVQGYLFGKPMELSQAAALPVQPAFPVSPCS